MNDTDKRKSYRIISLNPLGIGEGFEQERRGIVVNTRRLNPLGIGEGFELSRADDTVLLDVVLIP